MATSKTLNIKPGMTSKQIALAYSDFFGLSFVELKDKKISSDLKNYLNEKVAKEFKIIPIKFDPEKVLTIAVADPQQLQKKAPAAILDLKNKGMKVSLAIITQEDFEEAFFSLYRSQPEASAIEKKPIAPEKNASSTPIGGPPKEEYAFVELIGQKIPADILHKFPQDVAEKYKMVVFEAQQAENKIKVATVHPQDEATKEILDFIEKRNHLKIELFKTNQANLDYALKLYQEKSPLAAREVVRQDKKEAMSSIPLAKPLPDVSKVHSNLPPLHLAKNRQEDSHISKPTGRAEVKVEELTVNNNQQESGFTPIPEDEENNLDLLFVSGIGSEEKLSNVIKSGIIPKIVASITFYAVELEASDIHMEPTEQDFRLRYRIDGMLKDIIKMPKELQAPIVSRIKIMAKLKIDEQRIPQDGRFDVIASKKDIDFRVSTLPTIHGEKVVMRILDKGSVVKKIEELGFIGTSLQRLRENINKPHGLILATGPTGSGKSTTLYAILNEISRPEINVITLEDPVEYNIVGINQCQIKPKIGFGFAEGLRSIVRQDPNIIMVGEIRDTETAEMCTHAALTGHLVLSTLHTNDAAGALPRLIDMGIEPFLITSSINCIIAQRLVRKICPHCREEYLPPQPVLEEIKKELSYDKNSQLASYQNKELKFYKGKGCKLCNAGYKGRIGIYEVLAVTAKIESMAVHKEPANSIGNQAIEEGMITMKQDGIIKALKGLTSLDEVLRVTSKD